MPSLNSQCKVGQKRLSNEEKTKELLYYYAMKTILMSK